MTLIEIKPQHSNFFTQFWNWVRGKTQVIKYGTHLHFKGEGNTADKIEEGDILVGWHTNLKNKEIVFGTAIILGVDSNVAKAQIINYTKP